MDEKSIIPYAVMNWAKLVDGCYLIDHTRFIREHGFNVGAIVSFNVKLLDMLAFTIQR